ncbi:putative MarR family transcriptional regulator [Oscillibacter valericigenes Sjm18-20]|nr:putative MarR family transcriptional regulator [Oscillibacter valericigenes Sjm18-20]
MEIEEFKRMSTLMERIVHEYIQIEKRPWDYGNGLLLTRPEIHTVMLLSQDPGMSVTAVAQKRGITKGATSQMLYKMVDKGLVEKRVSPDSDAQVSLYLTPLGEKVSGLHDAYHRNNAEPIFQYFQSLPEDTLKALIGTLEIFDRALNARLETMDKQPKVSY